jgi:hypothetical protein
MSAPALPAALACARCGRGLAEQGDDVPQGAESYTCSPCVQGHSGAARRRRHGEIAPPEITPPSPVQGGRLAVRNAPRRSAGAIRQARWRSKHPADELLREAAARMRALRARRARQRALRSAPAAAPPRQYPPLAVLRAYRLGHLSLAAYLAAACQASRNPDPITTRRETP